PATSPPPPPVPPLYCRLPPLPRPQPYPLSLHDALPISCASSVGYIMALTQMPAKMTAFFLSISDNKYVILLLINVLLLVLGTLVDRKSTRLNSSHVSISYAVCCLKKKRYRRRRPKPISN